MKYQLNGRCYGGGWSMQVGSQNQASGMNMNQPAQK